MYAVDKGLCGRNVLHQLLLILPSISLPNIDNVAMSLYNIRIKPDRIPRQLLACKFEGGKHSVGGQKLQWVDVVIRDFEGSVRLMWAR